ncbi:MAG: heparinase II/III family protein [Pseudomonadota bacterium]
MQPEPYSIGSFARGRQLCAGNFVFAGHLVQQEGRSPWDIEPPTPGFAAELHGFAWLDDLAAAGDSVARNCATLWLWQWLKRFGDGSGPAWEPDLAGRRVTRWVFHAPFVMRGQDDARKAEFLATLGRNALYLSQRWHRAPAGLPRLEALNGLIHASVALAGLSSLQSERYIAALGRECERLINSDGGLASRNPEELLEIFVLLNWASLILSEDNQSPSPSHLAAVERIAPNLRALRHADGGLARFQGGGRGLEGRLDGALATSGIKPKKKKDLAMGFARANAGRTSIIIDAAPPPSESASVSAHASTLAFEMTSGRRSVIVNCGSGASFGPDWRRAGRATPSHSALILNNQSSSQMGRGERGENERLTHTPSDVEVRFDHGSGGITFEGGHDGYRQRFGLTHRRKLEMTFDGRGVAGEDMLLALDEVDKRRFDKTAKPFGLQGMPFDIRFHLHPDIDAAIDMGGSAVSMALKSGELWVFRFDGSVRMSLEPSVYLETNRLTPRSTQQIVLSSYAKGYVTRTRWSFAKPQDSPVGIRDLAGTAQTPVAID